MFDDLEAEGCSLCIRRLTGMVPHEHRTPILKPTVSIFTSTSMRKNTKVRGGSICQRALTK
jgi:hypothetical protein